MANLSDLTRVQKQAAAILNANPDDMSYAVAGTDQEKYAPQQITDAAFLIDLEICRWIQETIGHGYRSQYGEATPVNNGDILAHAGKIGYVRIRRTPDAPFLRGIVVSSIDMIHKFKINPDGRYPAALTAGRYHIDEEMKMEFIGDAAEVFVPADLVIGTVLLSPASYETAVIRGTVMMCAKDPLDPSLFGYWAQQYQADEGRIKNGAEYTPPLDMAARGGT